MLPILLMLLSGVIEFGFMLNYYLDVIDATRETARFAATTSRPVIRLTTSATSPPGATDTACPGVSCVPSSVGPDGSDVSRISNPRSPHAR